MATVKVREKEKERIYERKLLKERQLEDPQFADQPQFLTSAYKAKLLEEKKWEYEDKYEQLRGMHAS
jgi:coiled-coil domain-containing protein 55